jgi:transcription antitermination factor NusG
MLCGPVSQPPVPKVDEEMRLALEMSIQEQQQPKKEDSKVEVESS